MPMTPPGNSSNSEQRALQAVDLGDAVADLDDGTDERVSTPPSN